MTSINRKLIVTYTKVFGTPYENFNNDISTLDKTTWFKILARFNFLLRKKSKILLKDVLSIWFQEANNEYANELYKRILTAYHGEIQTEEDLTTLNFWTNLKLLDEILKSQVNSFENPVDSIETEKRLFFAYLFVNERFSLESDKIVEENEGIRSDLLLWYSKALPAMLLPYNDIGNVNVIGLLISQFIKSCLCFSFFEKHHSNLLCYFLQKYQIDNWREYLKAIMPVIHHSTFQKENEWNFLSVENSENKEKTRFFLNSLSISSDLEYEVKTDFLHARSNPLFKIDNDTYLAIDEVLLINKMYNSIFFELLSIVRQKGIMSNSSFFQLYTSEFIEHYLSYEVLDTIFSQRQIYKITGAQIKESFKVDTEPDYYARDGNKVYLFEIKGSILTGAAKQSFKFEEIEKELTNKYYKEDGRSKKAILQLVERIKILFEGGAKYDENYKKNSIRVYPILLVSEAALMCPGINYILNKWFKREVKNDDLLCRNQHRIYDLVILDIDTLILHTDQFKSDRQLFERMLLGYIKKSQVKRISPPPKWLFRIPSERMRLKELELIINDILLPYSSFVKDNVKATQPSLFLEFAKTIFPETV